MTATHKNRFPKRRADGTSADLVSCTSRSNNTPNGQEQRSDALIPPSGRRPCSCSGLQLERYRNSIRLELALIIPSLESVLFLATTLLITDIHTLRANERIKPDSGVNRVRAARGGSARTQRLSRLIKWNLLKNQLFRAEFPKRIRFFGCQLENAAPVEVSTLSLFMPLKRENISLIIFMEYIVIC